MKNEKEESEKIEFEQFYKNSVGYEFLIASLNMFEELRINEFIDSEDFESTAGYNMDKFNLLLINLAIALELSLKGIYILRKYNIFLLGDYDIEKIENIPNKILVRKSFALESLIQEKNLIKILDKKLIDKYMSSFKYLQKNRNIFVHFAHMSREIKGVEKEHLKLIKEFFEKYVRKFKEESASLHFTPLRKTANFR